MNKGKTG